MNASDADEGDIQDPDAEPVKNGLYCFFNGERECGADCMAYTGEPSENKALSMQQRSCVLIVSVDRLGRYLGNLATAAVKMQVKAATDSADRARQAATPPPDPRGNRP